MLDLENDTSGNLGVEGVLSLVEATSGGGPVLDEAKEDVEIARDLVSSSAFDSIADSRGRETLEERVIVTEWTTSFLGSRAILGLILAALRLSTLALIEVAVTPFPSRSGSGFSLGTVT